MVLHIRAGNPISEPQKVKIRSELPARVTTNDIISTDGLDVGYDVRNDRYYVHKELELGPKQIREFRVQLKDIWVISDDEIERCRQKAVTLVEMLIASQYKEEAAKLKEEVDKGIGMVVAVQKESEIKPGVKPQVHIEGYEKASRIFRTVKQDLGQMENLALAAGLNPGELIGEAKSAPEPKRDIRLKPEQYKTAIIRIVVKNTSPADVRKVTIRRDLPREVKIDDIIDAGGLEVKADPSRGGICTVFKEAVEIPANQSVVFNVKIRDRWNINGPRIEELAQRATNLLERIGEKEKFPEIFSMLEGILAELEKIKNEPVPQTLNEQYVAFFRGQAERIDVVEMKINRVEAALRPMDKTSKWGFKVKPPSMKTTWALIYIILGFLAVMSLLFFLRWYGKGADEKVGSASDDTGKPKSS